MPHETHAPIVVSALIIRNARGEVLTVRKRGTSGFMLPGGKPEPGETPEQTARRETTEELNLTLTAHTLLSLGTHEAAALNEPGRTVQAHVYALQTVLPGIENVTPDAEIEEIRWVHPSPTLADHSNQAPLNTGHIFPLIAGHESSSSTTA